MTTVAKYVMVFAFSEHFDNVLLLRKPDSHKNPKFAGRWTVPGGHVERGESEKDAAAREFQEETCCAINQNTLRFILRFSCNCDSTEDEHEVAVFGAAMPLCQLQTAKGSEMEPVRVFSDLPAETVSYLAPMIALTLDRMKQPIWMGKHEYGPSCNQQRIEEVPHYRQS